MFVLAIASPGHTGCRPLWGSKLFGWRFSSGFAMGEMTAAATRLSQAFGCGEKCWPCDGFCGNLQTGFKFAHLLKSSLPAQQSSQAWLAVVVDLYRVCVGVTIEENTPVAAGNIAFGLV
jgi:hypothetical protein